MSGRLKAEVAARLHTAGREEFLIMWEGSQVAICIDRKWAQRIANSLNRCDQQDRSSNWDPSEDG